MDFNVTSFISDSSLEEKSHKASSEELCFKTKQSKNWILLPPILKPKTNSEGVLGQNNPVSVP